MGGISRTVNYKGNRIDIGGHRFFSKSDRVMKWWLRMLELEQVDEPAHLTYHRHTKDLTFRGHADPNTSDRVMLVRRRRSRIYFQKQFFDYPFTLSLDTIRKLGIAQLIRIAADYGRSRLFPIRPEVNLEQFFINRFGRTLYQTFFKSYTEKVWGMPCTEISAEWSAQRIKGLSLVSALKAALVKKAQKKGDVIKTLIDTFHYPRKGPGMMWERVADIVSSRGSRVMMNSETVNILWSDRVTGIRIRENGKTRVIEGTDFVSSMPIRELIARFEPAAPEEVQAAANKLMYRDFLTVALIVNRDAFPDNWIYIHDPGVKLGRIQNFKSWSPELIPDPKTTCLGLEYFCFEGDGLWNMPDQDLVELGKKELEILGLVKASEVIEGSVVRMPKAYPVYDGDGEYREALKVVRRFVDGLGNLQLVGRNGMHKYNNQDHSMLTAMLAAKNILGAKFDLWGVNVDEEYHEEVKEGDRKSLDDFAKMESTQPRVPEKAKV